MMAKEWSEGKLQLYIDSFIEESLTLEYKAADSLARGDGKKTEITKDVSAMANSAGGMIVYGLKEHTDPTKKHLAETINPIDRMQFPKEWLEQIINNIRPRISGVIIHSINLSTGANDVAYVVEIPQSNTAHQATDHRYYRRYNFQSIAMEDHEIRDVMNRASSPDASIEFKHLRKEITSSLHSYRLEIFVKNLGIQVINHFQLEFTFPRIIGYTHNLIHKRDHIYLRSSKTHDHLIIYHSKTVLFPNEERDIGSEIVWDFEMNSEKYGELRSLELRGMEPTVEWTLYADNMTPKQGKVPFKNLNDY